MKKAFIATLLALASLSSAAASLEGTIRAINDQSGTRIGSTVDHWKFTARSTGLVAIDVLSWEAPSGIATDLNGDGEIAFFDSTIYLFRDDGTLDASDMVAANNDSSSTFDDGSQSELDSSLSLKLTAGNYLLAIGAYLLNELDAISGINHDTYYPVSCATPTGACTRVQNDHGDYRITVTGDVTAPTSGLPEPAAIGLIGLGLAGLGILNRRRR